MGQAVRGLDGKCSAVMLANHSPVVADGYIEAACNAIEELEATGAPCPADARAQPPAFDGRANQ